MVLYYHQVQDLLGQMNGAKANTKKQLEILGELAGPLQRYSKYLTPLALCIWPLVSISAEAVEAVGAHPFELDPIRRRLCKLFDLPPVTTGQTLFGESPFPHDREPMSRNPLISLLHYIRRVIYKRGLEEPVYGAIDVVARQMIAFIGGLSLIVPIVIMTFLGSLKARLIVMCCFVGGFAALIGIFTRATNREVLAATAVYTAVLAVFVPDRSS